MTTQGVAENPARWVPSDKTFGARLAMVRHQMGWNVKEAADNCGLAEATWRVYEAGRIPRHHVEVAKQISDRVGCEYLWLLLGPDRGAEPVPSSSDGVTRRYRAARVLLTAGRHTRALGPVEATCPLAPAA